MCLIRTSRSCRLNAIFFFYEKSWKIISRTDSFGLLFIEITMLLNFQWKKIIKKKNWEINRAFHVLLYFVILPWKFYLYCVWTSTLYRKRVYITPEVVFFRYTNSVDGVAAIEFPDRYCQSETEEIARTIFESKHLWTIINRIQILPRYIFFPRWFSIFLLSFRGVTVIVTNWK